jgi:hypothetical protein
MAMLEKEFDALEKKIRALLEAYLEVEEERDILQDQVYLLQKEKKTMTTRIETLISQLKENPS